MRQNGTETETYINRRKNKTRMWANAQRDGRPVEHRWHPLFNATVGWVIWPAKTVPEMTYNVFSGTLNPTHLTSPQRRKVWLTLTTWLPCSNAAKMQKPLKLAGLPQTTGSISAASRLKLTILWGHLEEILLLNKFFSIVDMCFSWKDKARQSLRWRLFGDFLRPAFQRAAYSTFQTCILNSH